MVVWRGFGILAFFLIAGGAALGGSTYQMAGSGIGIVVGGLASYFLGQYLNIQRPEQQINQAIEQRAHQLHAAAENGTFYLGPGNPMPTSRAEAHAQADQLLEQERARIADAGRNTHTLFWIPMQYIGLIAAVGGLIMAVAGLIN